MLVDFFALEEQEGRLIFSSKDWQSGQTHEGLPEATEPRPLGLLTDVSCVTEYS